MTAKCCGKAPDQYVNGIICDEDSPVSVEVRRAKAGEMTAADRIELVSRLIDADNISNEELGKAIADFEEKINSLNNLIGKADEYIKLEAALERDKAALEDEKAKAEALKP